MQLALALFPETDTLDLLIEQSMPWFTLWLFALALILVSLVIGQAIQRYRTRSPVEKMLRKRFG